VASRPHRPWWLPLRAGRSDTTTNDAWFDLETFADETEMKSELRRGDSTDLDIYSTSGGGFLGDA
jgi:hypothetical protein